MRGGRHLRPLRVHQIASQMLEVGRLRAEPPWYRVVGNIPPTTSLVRTLPVPLQKHTPSKTKLRKPSGLYKPQRIAYPEDELRARFFQDHPWELARPRILVENNGKDHVYHDWSKIEQPGKQLDGESVVQRQLWLMKNERLSKAEAYDRARKEFYDLRMYEDIERRIAAEEALYVGAEFGKSHIEIGLELEEQALEEWRKKATQVLMVKRGKRAAFAGARDEEEGQAEFGEVASGEGEEAVSPIAATG